MLQTVQFQNCNQNMQMEKDSRKIHQKTNVALKPLWLSGEKCSPVD